MGDFMKNFKKFLFFLIIIIVFLLNGCSIATSGNTLHGFTMRMNQKNPLLSMTDSGYIYDGDDNTLTKYFIINNSNIMLCFEADESHQLSSLNIVFDNVTENNTEEIDFIKSCIECYCDDYDLSDKLLSGADFPQVLFTKNINTIKNKVGNTEMLIDVTDIGCVISVVQSTQ